MFKWIILCHEQGYNRTQHSEIYPEKDNRLIRSTSILKIRMMMKMMLFLQTILIIFTLPTTFGVRCFVHDRVDVPVFPNMISYLEQIFNKTQTKDQPFCQVTLNVDTTLPETFIFFEEIDSNTRRSNLSNIYTEVNSMYEFLNVTNKKSEISINTRIKFICYNMDHCDRFLIFEYIRWFLSDSDQELIDVVQTRFGEKQEQIRKFFCSFFIKFDNVTCILHRC